MIKAEFSASLLQSSVSHDPSEIILICWFAAYETFLLFVENSCSLLFCGHLVFQDFVMNRKYKITEFTYNRIFWHIINAFTLTSDQFNASLSINK